MFPDLSFQSFGMANLVSVAAGGPIDNNFDNLMSAKASPTCSMFSSSVELLLLVEIFLRTSLAGDVDFRLEIRFFLIFLRLGSTNSPFDSAGCHVGSFISSFAKSVASSG